jgi:hypothetical protein
MARRLRHGNVCQPDDVEAFHRFEEEMVDCQWCALVPLTLPFDGTSEFPRSQVAKLGPEEAAAGREDDGALSCESDVLSCVPGEQILPSWVVFGQPPSVISHFLLRGVKGPPEYHFDKQKAERYTAKDHVSS